MEYAYALYDALLSISVPGDKARAVVAAPERDMGSTLATKMDLQVLGNELHREMDLLRKDLELVRREIVISGNQVAVRVGSVVILSLGILFAALKLT